MFVNKKVDLFDSHGRTLLKETALQVEQHVGSYPDTFYGPTMVHGILVLVRVPCTMPGIRMVLSRVKLNQQADFWDCKIVNEWPKFEFSTGLYFIVLEPHPRLPFWRSLIVPSGQAINFWFAQALVASESPGVVAKGCLILTQVG